jgi:hypothetical protein
VSNNPLRYIDPSGHFCVDLGTKVICSDDDDDSYWYWWLNRSSGVVYEFPSILQFGPGTTRSLPLQEQSHEQEDGESLPIELFYPYPNPVDPRLYEYKYNIHLKPNYWELQANLGGLLGDFLSPYTGGTSWLLGQTAETVGLTHDLMEMKEKTKENGFVRALFSRNGLSIIVSCVDIANDVLVLLPPPVGTIFNITQLFLFGFDVSFETIQSPFDYPFTSID